MVVPMEKELQTSLMHEQGCARRTAFCEQNEPGVVGVSCSSVPHEPFHLVPFRQHCAVLLGSRLGRLESQSVKQWPVRACEGNGLPQTATGALASISDRVSDHLTALSAQGNPDPCLVDLSSNKGPQFIQFQGRRSWIGGIRSYHCLAQGWKLSGFF
jgi:hypothetical protein